VPAMKKKRIVKNKSSQISVNRDRVITFLKKGIPVVIIICVFVAVMLILRQAFFSIPYFRVADIKITSRNADFAGFNSLTDSEMLRMCRGENIFKINIKQLADSIKRDYPQLKNAAVSRVMPNILEIAIVTRVPAAVISSFGNYPVDNERVVLSPDIKFNKVLPVISGLSLWIRPKIGEVLDSGKLLKALQLIKLFKENDISKICSVKGVDMSNKRNVIVVLESGIEVRMGSDKFGSKINKLATILEDDSIDKNNLEYIDLRFDDIVLGPR
jgi:cell division septal protein FtsQ